MSSCPIVCQYVLLFVNIACRPIVRQYVLLFVNLACLCYSFLPFFSYHPTWYMWVHVSYFFFQLCVCYVLYVIYTSGLFCLYGEWIGPITLDMEYKNSVLISLISDMLGNSPNSYIKLIFGARPWDTLN